MILTSKWWQNPDYKIFDMLVTKFSKHRRLSLCGKDHCNGKILTTALSKLF